MRDSEEENLLPVTESNNRFVCVDYLVELLLLCCIMSLFFLSQPDYSYDYYVFAQQWPSALCNEINKTHHGSCTKVPEKVDSWVVHGLWPSKSHVKKHGPFACNSSWPYNHNDVVSILPRMEKFWPNLMQNTPDDSFWKHEWEKHGTCACQHDSCSSEKVYFEKALDIRDRLDCDGLLAAHGITPSEEQGYDFASVSRAISNGFDGEFQCYGPQRHDYQVLAQVYICLDKEFNQVRCEDVRGRKQENLIEGFFNTGPYDPRSCREDVPVMIYPVHMPMTSSTRL